MHFYHNFAETDNEIVKIINKIPNSQQCDLRKIEAFKRLKPDEIEMLAEERYCSYHNKGAILYREGNRINGFYCIHKGIVKLFKTGINGKEQIIKFAKQGDIIGYRSIVSHENACTTARIIQESYVSFISSHSLMTLVKANYIFSLALMQLACKELDEANNTIIKIAQKTVKERLAEVLILLKRDFELDNKQNLQISLTREELANMVGTATESVIRLLADFKANGYIALDGRKIRIIDEKALLKLGKIND